MSKNATWFVGLIVLLSAVGLLTASEIRLGGQEGTTDKPNPAEGAETEENLNPTVTCCVEEGDDVEDLLGCLVDGIEDPLAGGDDECGSGGENAGNSGGPPCPPGFPCLPPLDQFSAERLNLGDPDGPWGLVLRRDYDPDDLGLQLDPEDLFNYELERIEFREDDPEIQTTELRNELPFRVARILGVGLEPVMPEEDENRAIHIELDDQSVSVTTWQKSAQQINFEIWFRIRQAGFVADFRPACISSDPCFIVEDADGINRVLFRSTDPSITRSDISLLPPDDIELVETPAP